jgi:hypothetical protein
MASGVKSSLCHWGSLVTQQEVVSCSLHIRHDVRRKRFVNWYGGRSTDSDVPFEGRTGADLGDPGPTSASLFGAVLGAVRLEVAITAGGLGGRLVDPE